MKQFKLLNFARKLKNIYFNPDNGLDSFFGNKDRISLNIDHSKKPDIRIPNKIQKFIKKNKIEILDYEKGTVKYKDSKNIYKLSKFIKNKKLLSLFVNDPQRADYSNTKVIFSRKPIDLISLSYKRNWSSCLNIYDNVINEYYIPENLSDLLLEGLAFPAYLVDKNDNRIKKPHGRILIYPIINQKTDEILFYPVSPEYGNFPKYIQDQVKEFVKGINKKNITQSGEFFFDKNTYIEKFWSNKCIYVFKNIKDYLKFNKIPLNENLIYDNFNLLLSEHNTNIYIIDNTEKIKVNRTLEIIGIENGLDNLGVLFEFPNNHLEFCNLDVGYLYNFKGFPEKINTLIIRKNICLMKKETIDIFDYSGSLKEVDYYYDPTYFLDSKEVADKTLYFNIQDFPIINKYISNTFGEKNLKELKRLKKLKYVSKKIKRKGI